MRGGVKLYFEISNKDRFFPPIQTLKSKDWKNKIYIKRDDLIPVSFGGNKARKAEYFFREIDNGGYDSVVTYGSSSSNHCRIVANMAAARGLPCYIISPEEASEPTFNSKMVDELFKAKRTTVPVKEVHNTIEAMLSELKEIGKKPYFIPGGGHGNLGTQAYVDCYEEIREYEAQNNIHFDYIFHASGTGTTQAGLVCGQLIHGDKRKIVGISIARKNPRGRDVVLDSVRDYFNEKKILVDEKSVQEATIFEDAYTGDGYGKENAEINQTIRDVLIQHGIPLDATYTGKAFCGLKRYLNENGIAGKNILFIHTGGTPLFFNHLA